MEGWIKLHRKILDNPISQKPEYAWLWITLLLKANHKEKKFMWNGEIIVIKEGQLITSRVQLSKETGISETTIERILKVLESSKQIGQQKTTKFRLITVINWKDYQENGQQTDNKRTTNGHKQECNNDKNEKNEKKESVVNSTPPSEKNLKPKPNSPRGWANLRRAEIGKPPIRTPRSEKQVETFEALKWKDYFREQGYSQHGMQFMTVHNEKREKQVSAGIIRVHQVIGEKMKEFIDWWFSGEGEFWGYEPEQCFMDKRAEKFLNKSKKQNKPLSL